MKNKLLEYQEKRDFKKTIEPKGKITKSKKKLKYAIQYHESRKNHYDLRLEHEGVLLSFAIPKGPSLNPKDKRLAIKVEDHPLDYLEFEGIIPKGQYGGGTVLLFDIGFWKPLSNVNKALKNGVLKFIINGERIKGQFVLIKLKDDNNSWLLIKEQDEYVRKSSGISKFKTSIKSSKTISELNSMTKNPFSNPNLELALLKEEVPTSKDWLYEIKFDGYRILSEIENDQVKLFTRNHINYTLKFPYIVDELKEFSNQQAMILDGEIIYPDEMGRSSFSNLLKSIKNKDTYPLVYVIFDILAYLGKDLRNITLEERRKVLNSLFHKKYEHLILSQELKGDGKKIFLKAKSLSLEGIIAKNIYSLYSGKRSGEWVKIKCRKSDEFIIGGFIISDKKEHNLKSILVGEKKECKLIFKGKVGTGFSLSYGKELLDKFNKYIVKTNPFINCNLKNVIYLKPHFICEIEFAEYTKNNVLRQPSFKAIREDKKLVDLDKKDVDQEYNITSKDKIIYPEKKITKLDIAKYYDSVAPYMLNYIKNRPIAVLRANQGIENAFFKKHPEKEKEGIGIFTQNKNKYFYIKNKDGILNEIQLGSVEFHVWGSTYDKINKPDYMVFDLDPDESVDLKAVRKGAKDLKKILNNFSLTSFLKTSGGKGYHIIVPFSDVKDWQTFEDFSHKIALLMETKYPDLYVSNMSKKKRKGKVFIDWMRNRLGATSIAPYSLRCRKNASVSMPISWNELDKIAPNEIDIFSALGRIKKNPWKNYEKIKKIQKLK